jgi:hypothetical protein
MLPDIEEANATHDIGNPNAILVPLKAIRLKTAIKVSEAKYT